MHVCVCLCWYRLYIDVQGAVPVCVCFGVGCALSHSEPCVCVWAGICCALSHGELAVCICVCVSVRAVHCVPVSRVCMCLYRLCTESH